MHRVQQLLLAVVVVALAGCCCCCSNTSAQSVPPNPSIVVCWLDSDHQTNRSVSADTSSHIDVCSHKQCDQSGVVSYRVRSRGDDAGRDVLQSDSTLLPDFWNAHGVIDSRIPTNGADPPEQFVKVTDRRHRHPVFATICSIAFLLTIITIIIVCTH